MRTQPNVHVTKNEPTILWLDVSMKDDGFSFPV